jgi:hypothetical protein
VRNAHRILALTFLLAAACQPPAEDIGDATAVPDTTPAARARVASDVFDGCYYQGQRFSVGAVKIQDGVLKKCIEERSWHNVDGFGNVLPEDPSVEDTLSPVAPEATTETGQAEEAGDL